MLSVFIILLVINFLYTLTLKVVKIMAPKPDYTIVLYTAAYCPYCKDFKPTWDEFCKKAKTAIKNKEKSMKIETMEITRGDNR